MSLLRAGDQPGDRGTEPTISWAEITDVRLTPASAVRGCAHHVDFSGFTSDLESHHSFRVWLRVVADVSRPNGKPRANSIDASQSSLTAFNTDS